MQKHRHGEMPFAARLRTGPKAVYAARTLETSNFRIHYALRGINRAKTVEADLPLVRAVDSLYAALPPGLSDFKADSTVYRRLDAAGAPHPVFTTTLAGFLEQARDYYVATLKMKAPRLDVPSHYYQVPAHRDGKYSVDVVDIGTAEPNYQGDEIYALTYPPQDGGMLMENDFLFRSRLETDGTVSGDSIQSRYQGKTLHNYVLEWQAGLKVTCFHEYYHSVQFTYVPNSESFHVWYETGAVGMEERNAPEVDDYLQYLPALFADLRQSMPTYVRGLSQYGNGIFHVFLTQELGEDFDVRLWSRLRDNGDNLNEAIATVFASYGRNTKDLYSRYAAQLSVSGTDLKNPLVPFSPDIPRWPTLPYDSLDLRTLTTYVVPRQPPLSLRAFKLTGAAGSGKALFLQDSALVPVLARLEKSASMAEFPAGSRIDLEMPDPPDRSNFLLVANGSLEKSGQAEIKTQISKVDTSVYAYPNPLTGVQGRTQLLFSRIGKPVVLRIYGEAGKTVRELQFTPASPLWSWDLTDLRGVRVKSGLYYYRADDGHFRALYLY